MNGTPKKSYDRKRTCNVCGREIESYERICHRCGSIQRFAGGDGLPVASEGLCVCGNCGRRYARADINSPDDLCPDCDAILNPKKRRLSSIARERIAYSVFFSLIAASIAVSLWIILAGASVTVLVEVLGIAGLAFFVSVASIAGMMISKRRKVKPRVLPRADSEGETDYDYLP